jgi:hypothetical protein
MIRNAIAVPILAAILLAGSACSPSAQNDTAAGRETTALAGTYYYEGGDAGGRQKITLELRSNGTYTKEMKADAGGLTGLGGKHSGTWRASGTEVWLSGDGTWPQYTHDLSAFRKVR